MSESDTWTVVRKGDGFEVQSLYISSPKGWFVRLIESETEAETLAEWPKGPPGDVEPWMIKHPPEFVPDPR